MNNDLEDIQELIQSKRVVYSSSVSSSTDYTLNIGTGEKGGLIQITHGFTSEAYALYEFHLFNDIVNINKISGTDFIKSFEYIRDDSDNGSLNIVGSQTYLRFRAFFH